MADETNNNKEVCKWSYPERWGFTIIGFLILGSIVMLVGWFLTKGYAPQSHHIHFLLTPDTIPDTVKDMYTRAEVDSLIIALQNHEALLEQKYQYILDQHEEEDRLRMWATIIVGMILSIAAFFGFKNITELKQQCREEASTTAAGIAQTTAESVAEKKADEKAREVAAEVAKTTTVDLVKETCGPIATEIAQTTAKDTVGEYLRLNFKNTVDTQLSYIQETTVFKNLKRENEDVIRLEIERIRSLVAQNSSSRHQPAEENPIQVEPQINLDIPNED